MSYNNILFVSAVNISNGGPMVILNEYIEKLAIDKPNFKIVVCVNSMYNKIIVKQNISYLEFNYPTRNFVFRLFFEYIHLYILSIKIRPLGVISFNDITPNMMSKFKFNYIHSPMSFENFKFIYFLISPFFFAKIIFFRFIHHLTINNNDIIIVQQNQIKRKIINLYRVNENKIFVCNPTFNFNDTIPTFKNYEPNKAFILFYPSVPRTLKNIHLVCEAVMRINLFTKHKIILQITLDGSENSYAKKIEKTYKKYAFINFLGIIKRENVLNHMKLCDAVIFASEFETWGLPISESKFYNKEIFLLDMEYAHETISSYNKAIFFTKDNLCSILLKKLNGDFIYTKTSFPVSNNLKFIDILNKKI